MIAIAYATRRALQAIELVTPARFTCDHCGGTNWVALGAGLDGTHRYRCDVTLQHARLRTPKVVCGHEQEWTE
jgi:hypothetical protein